MPKTIGDLIRELSRFNMNAKVKLDYFDPHFDETTECLIEEIEDNLSGDIVTIAITENG